MSETRRTSFLDKAGRRPSFSKERKSMDGERAPKVSYGRGGAGNIGPPSPSLKPANGLPNFAVGAGDFDTPTLKTAKYTTGRGGIGNMAKNDPERPQLAREAQDVDPPLSAQMKKVGQFHTGIGGTGNTYKLSETEEEEAREHNRLVKTKSRDQETLRKENGGVSMDQVKGLAAKGKEKVLGR